MLTKEQKAVQAAFVDEVNRVSVLDEKTQFMVKLAAIMAIGCQP